MTSFSLKNRRLFFHFNISRESSSFWSACTVAVQRYWNEKHLVTIIHHLAINFLQGQVLSFSCCSWSIITTILVQKSSKEGKGWTILSSYPDETTSAERLVLPSNPCKKSQGIDICIRIKWEWLFSQQDVEREPRLLREQAYQHIKQDLSSEVERPYY